MPVRSVVAASNGGMISIYSCSCCLASDQTEPDQIDIYIHSVADTFLRSAFQLGDEWLFSNCHWQVFNNKLAGFAD